MDGAPVVDTDDLRAGVPIHDALLALLPLVGRWHGAGDGVVASSGRRFSFGQHVVITHDGRPFLAYDSRSWLIGDDGQVLRLAWRESGFWRRGPGADDLELVLASNTGQALVFTGTAGDQRWELETVSAVHAPSAEDVDGERRLYAVRGDTLVYATELAPGGAPFAAHLNAELTRVRTAGATAGAAGQDPA